MARILVIDDEAEIRAVLGQTLKSAGHEVVLAANGKVGMKLHYAQPADLLITDLFMPGQDGLETIVWIHRDFPTLPIIAMSGNPAAKSMLATSLRLGAVTILEKPFHPDEVLAAVEKALATKS